MTPIELVQRISGGTKELVLDQPLLRLNIRRTRSNPCHFDDFLSALGSNVTLESVECATHTDLGISKTRWASLVRTIGAIRNLQCLKLCWMGSSTNTCDHWADVAMTLQAASFLRELTIRMIGVRMIPSARAGLETLAGTLREHKRIQTFVWHDSFQRGHSHFDRVLESLGTCPQLQQVDITTRCASAEALANLLQCVPQRLRLVLNMDQWSGVTDRIARGQCSVRSLTLHIIHVYNGNDDQTIHEVHAAAVRTADEPVEALAVAIEQGDNPNLEDLELRFDTEKSITNAAGRRLARALTDNQTLRTFSLANAALEVPSYEAFSTMLGANTGLVLVLTPLAINANDSLLESQTKMEIEQRLNLAGRGRLLQANRATREEWVGVLNELIALSVDDDSTDFQVSCLFEFLQRQPPPREITNLSPGTL